MKKIPSDLHKALRARPQAKVKWEDLTPIARRDFVSWVESAKQRETRNRRVLKACDMLISGKRRPCCYAIVPMKLYTALNENSKAKTLWKDLTPDERRDFIGWIESAQDPKEHTHRIAQTSSMLAAGKRRP